MPLPCDVRLCTSAEGICEKQTKHKGNEGPKG
jgi:hypothetical protein